MSNEIEVDGGGERKNEGKAPMELIPPSLLFAVADVLENGKKKYSPRNWERGMKWSICYACILRHLCKWFMGEENDPESGLHHLHHVACNVAFLIEYVTTYPEGDDRPKRSK